jgi:hypothetical protein
MNINRRRLLAGAAAGIPLACMGSRAFAQTAGTLKISHQFPGAVSADQGDFRDRLCRKFGAEVEKRTQGALKFEVYPNSSLMKVNTQFASLRRGALDLSLVPISYAGGEVAEVTIGPAGARAVLRGGKRLKTAEAKDARRCSPKRHRHQKLDLAGGRRCRSQQATGDARRCERNGARGAVARWI